MLKKEHWKKGYANEGCQAVIDYAFYLLKVYEVIAQIRTDNKSSCQLAKRLGMDVIGEFYKYYQFVEMKHFIYSLKKRGIRHVCY